MRCDRLRPDSRGDDGARTARGNDGAQPLRAREKIEPSQLPLLIAVLDEFFILSGKWQRLMKSGDEATRKLLAELDPLGAWADLAVLAAPREYGCCWESNAPTLSCSVRVPEMPETTSAPA